jgi:hypothetical protein
MALDKYNRIEANSWIPKLRHRIDIREIKTRIGYQMYGMSR